jgi:hypothetical protein
VHLAPKSITELTRLADLREVAVTQGLWLIDEERVEIERNAPAQDNESVEGLDRADQSKSPIFEE